MVSKFSVAQSPKFGLAQGVSTTAWLNVSLVIGSEISDAKFYFDQTQKVEGTPVQLHIVTR
jgi:hypothetical protein